MYFMLIYDTLSDEPWNLFSNAKDMPSGVLDALEQVCQEQGHLTPSQAKEYITHMENAKRLQMETWL